MRIIRTCKGCKTAWTIDYDQFDQRIDRSGPGGMYERVVRSYFRVNENGVKLAALGYTTDGVCSKCNSNARVSGSIVKGRVTGHKCDAKCVASKGHVCECSCGGKNHGSGFLPVAA